MVVWSQLVEFRWNLAMLAYIFNGSFLPNVNNLFDLCLEFVGLKFYFILKCCCIHMNAYEVCSNGSAVESCYKKTLDCNPPKFLNCLSQIHMSPMYFGKFITGVWLFCRFVKFRVFSFFSIFSRVCEKLFKKFEFISIYFIL